MYKPTPLALFTLGGVVLCWMVFAAVFLMRKKPPKEAEAKRDRVSLLGIFLQMCAYFLLRAAFGKEFEDYADRVPAVLPGIF
jgi:protein-S-isoprenylcysteine O-methyltransferase Ste14